MAKIFATCRIDGLIEFHEQHPGDGYYALAVGDLPSLREAIFATSEPQLLAQDKVARRVPGVTAQGSERQNLEAIARYIQSLSLMGKPGVRALGA